MTFRFGLASEIDAEYATVAFLGTILFLVLFEYMTQMLELRVGRSPTYNKMLQKIYMELMSNGFVSFAFAMFQASQPSILNKEWVPVIDFVGYIVFFVAIFFVAHALYIMALSIMSSKHYDQLHSLLVSDVLNELHLISPSKLWMHIRCFPFSALRSKVEFKIIFSVFRDTYWIPSNFNFGKYLSGCFERYSLRIISISNSSWALLAVLCGINYLRIRFGGLKTWNCRGFKYGDENNGDEVGPYGITERCNFLHLQLYFVCGCLLSVYILVVYLIGRLYILRLLAHAGVTDVGDYKDFLVLDESSTLKDEMQRRVEIDLGPNTGGGKRRARTMSLATLRNNVDRMTHKHGEGTDAGKECLSRASSTDAAEDTSFAKRALHLLNPFGGWSFEEREKSEERMERVNHIIQKKPRIIVKEMPESRRTSLQLTLTGGPVGMIHQSSQVKPPLQGMNSAQMTAIRKFKRKKQQQGADGNERRGSLLGAVQSILSTTGSTMKLSRTTPSTTSHQEVEEEAQMKLSEDFSCIYMFGNSGLYFRTVEFGIILNSLYLAMWVTNFITVVHYATRYEILWQLLMMGPLVIVLPVIGQIVKTASLLSAISELDMDAMGHVLEEMEDQQHLLEQLQKNIMARIGVRGAEAKEIIETLFENIDSNGNGSLNQREVREFLRALHLHYSNDKFRRLFKAMDFNRDGSISCNELYKLLCPDDALEEERQARKAAVSMSQHPTLSASSSLSSNSSYKNSTYNPPASTAGYLKSLFSPAKPVASRVMPLIEEDTAHLPGSSQDLESGERVSPRETKVAEDVGDMCRSFGPSGDQDDGVDNWVSSREAERTS